MNRSSTPTSLNLSTYSIMSTAHILGKSVLSAIFDNQQLTCRISRRFAYLLMIPESTEHVSLPVNADMGSGYLTSVVNLNVDLHVQFILEFAVPNQKLCLGLMEFLCAYSSSCEWTLCLILPTLDVNPLLNVMMLPISRQLFLNKFSRLPLIFFESYALPVVSDILVSLLLLNIPN